MKNMNKRRIVTLVSAFALIFIFFNLDFVSASPRDVTEINGGVYRYFAESEAQDDMPYKDQSGQGTYPYLIRLKAINTKYDLLSHKRVTTKIYISAYYEKRDLSGNLISAYWGAAPQNLLQWSADYMYDTAATQGFQWEIYGTWKTGSFAVSPTGGAASHSTLQYSINGEYAYIGSFTSTQYACWVHEYSAILKLKMYNDVARDYGNGHIDGNYKYEIKGIKIWLHYDYYLAPGLVFFKYYEIDHVLGDGSPGDTGMIPLDIGTPSSLL